MVEFTDGERSWHEEMRGITKDANGRDVLVGLTMEETEFYLTYSRRFGARDRDRDPANQARMAELRRKHDIARCQVIGAEVEARNDGSPRH